MNNTKICTTCERELTYGEFYRDSSKGSGLRSLCKECTREKGSSSKPVPWETRRLSLRDYVTVMYNSMRRRSGLKGMSLLTRNEFIELAMASNELYRLHLAWIHAGFARALSPSVDRINNSGGYLPGNIQFITHGQNASKGNSETKTGVTHRATNGKCVEVIRGSEKLEFSSRKGAAEFLGVSRPRMTTAIKKGSKVRGWSVQDVD